MSENTASLPAFVISILVLQKKEAGISYPKLIQFQSEFFFQLHQCLILLRHHLELLHTTYCTNRFCRCTHPYRHHHFTILQPATEIILQLRNQCRKVLCSNLIIHYNFKSGRVIEQHRTKHLHAFCDSHLLFRQLTCILLPIIIQIPFIEVRVLFRLLYSGNMSYSCILRGLIALRILDRYAQTGHLHHRNLSFLFGNRRNSCARQRSG